MGGVRATRGEVSMERDVFTGSVPHLLSRSCGVEAAAMIDHHPNVALVPISLDSGDVYAVFYRSQTSALRPSRVCNFDLLAVLIPRVSHISGVCQGLGRGQKATQRSREFFCGQALLRPQA